MLEVRFHNDAEDSLLRFAVIVSRSDGKWVFCKHRKRETYEVPGGRREPGEPILETAKRELYEETGALDYDMWPVCVYSVAADGQETYGMLYFADIRTFEGELHSEIERISVMKRLPENWTYPLIQPKLIGEVRRRGFLRA